MQRVEPSKIHDYTEATVSEPRIRARHVDEFDDEPLSVEATPVHLPEDTGSYLGWGTLLFCVFWLGGCMQACVQG